MSFVMPEGNENEENESGSLVQSSDTIKNYIKTFNQTDKLNFT